MPCCSLIKVKQMIAVILGYGSSCMMSLPTVNSCS